MARAIPVFPLVASIIVSPGFNRPRSSASSKIHFTGLSLIEPPGFTDSSLAYNFSDSFTKGVLPTKLETTLKLCSSFL